MIFRPPGPDAQAFVGSWSLVDYTLDDGQTSGGPFGARPGGLLSYSADGAMSAHLVALDGRAPSGSPAYVAYFGAFAVDAGTTTVTHHVHAASDAALAGKELQRVFRFDGEDRLVLTACIGRRTHRLVWQRAGTVQ